MSGLLLDTSAIVMMVARRGAVGQEIASFIDANKGARRPMACVVTEGEIRSLARRNSWGGPKAAALDAALSSLVMVDINSRAVIDAYVEIDAVSHAHPAGSRVMGKNDLWIAAATKATGAHLITTDADFDHLMPAVIQGRRFRL
jgi:predicted nucleic acid-binding protein